MGSNGLAWGQMADDTHLLVVRHDCPRQAGALGAGSLPALGLGAGTLAEVLGLPLHSKDGGPMRTADSHFNILTWGAAQRHPEFVGNVLSLLSVTQHLDPSAPPALVHSRAPRVGHMLGAGDWSPASCQLLFPSSELALHSSPPPGPRPPSKIMGPLCCGLFAAPPVIVVKVTAEVRLSSAPRR